MSTTAPIEIVGDITIAISLISKVIGCPDQIIKIFRRKSTEGISFANWFIGLIAYAVWTLYGFLKQDWVIVWSQVLGIVLCGIVVAQFAIYRNR